MINLYPSKIELVADAKEELNHLLTDLRKRLTILVTSPHVNNRESRAGEVERVIKLLEDHYYKICEHSPQSALEMIFSIRNNLPI